MLDQQLNCIRPFTDRSKVQAHIAVRV